MNFPSPYQEETIAEKYGRLSREAQQAQLERLTALAPRVARFRAMAEGAASTTEEWRTMVGAINRAIYDAFQRSGRGVETCGADQDITLQIELMGDLEWLRQHDFIGEPRPLFYRELKDYLSQFRARQKSVDDPGVEPKIREVIEMGRARVGASGQEEEARTGTMG